MNNITWTDRPDGRQFWQWDARIEEWVKTLFISWSDLKRAKTGA